MAERGINYASKYSPLVDERFTQVSLTQAAINTDLDFTGVNTVNVYSMYTADLNDYSMTGTSRYGTPTELEDSTQTLVLTQDKAFTFSIDRRNYEDSMMVREAGRALNRQLTEVIVPEVDKYRLAKLTADAGTKTYGAITSENAYTSFLAGVTTLLDAKAPLAGTFAFIGSNLYTQIRLDPSFIKASDMAQTMLVNGQVGTIEGIPVIHVPSTLLPDNVEFIITNRIAMPSAQKIESYKIHENPVGISGWLIEGRIYYDAWVLTNKAPVVYVHLNGTNPA